MSTTRAASRRRALVFSLISTSALALGALVFSTAPAIAQPSTPCEEMTDVGDRLKCKHAKLVSKQGEMIKTLRSEYSDDMSETELRNMDRLDKQQARADRHERRTGAKEFRQLGRRQKTVCEIKEHEFSGGDHDGICEKNEICEEAIDQIGNDDGICETKGKIKEVCVEICGPGAVSGDTKGLGDDEDRDLDGSLVEDLDQAYDDLAEQFDDLTGLLQDKSGDFRKLSSNLRYAKTPSEACKYTVDWTNVVIPIQGAVKVTNNTVRGVADIAERGCDQSFFGNNGATVCTIFEIAAAVTNVTEAIFEGVVNGLAANLQDDTGGCLEVMSSDIRDIKVTSAAGAAGAEGMAAALALHDGNLTAHDSFLGSHDAALFDHDDALGDHDRNLGDLMDEMKEELSILELEQEKAFMADMEVALVRGQCVPSMWLPKEHGGSLERIRDHVAGMVSRAAASGAPGADPGTAAKNVATADALIASGQYLKACQRLAQAMNALSR